MNKKTNTPFHAEGGGGCFPAGTKVNTPLGYRNIEDIQVGDSVYAFDLRSIEPGQVDIPGHVSERKVVETFIHTFGEVGYTSPLLIITHEKGVLNVTGNHYILTPSRVSKHKEADESFVRADELEVGDTLYTEYGDAVLITDIQDGPEYDFVYNLEVDELHTYIADKIRVHNGGGGKDQKSPVQAPNSVRSKQVIRVLMNPSTGESGGLYNSADPAQSVYFDGTPLKNSDGSFNFNNITVDQRVGTPSQSVIPGFSSTESEYLLNLAVTTTTLVTRTITSAAIDAARITIEFPQGLQSVDIKTGDSKGTLVQLRISTRVSNGTWSSVMTPSISEMSSGKFQVAYLVQRPTAAGTWEFKVERITADSTSNYLINNTSVKSYTEIRNVQLPYNGYGLVALTVGADSTNENIPSIAFDWVGVKCKVPSNYNAATKTYTGTWDGSWSSTYVNTDNPAWCLYDMLTNDDYGLGSVLDESAIDKFSFYNAAVYCDQLIDNGLNTGTFEPRFTFNAQFMVRENAWKSAQAVASTFNAKMYSHGGMVRLAQDRPVSATRLITNSDVIGATFTYSSSGKNDRYTACNVTYNNPNDNFLPTTITEVGTVAEINRYGYQSTDLMAYGATTEGQARRAAKWVIRTSLDTTAMVDFVVSAKHADFEPNEVFKLMDSDYAQVTYEGRITAISGTTLTLDKSFVKAASGTWTIDVYAADGKTIESRTITNAAGTVTSVTVNSAVTASVGSTYIITGAVSPRQFRVYSMIEDSPGVYKVSATEYNPNKYAAVESGIVVPPPVYWQRPDLSAIGSPSALVIVPKTTTTPEGMILRYLNVSWDQPTTGVAARYSVAYRKDSQPLTTLETIIPFVKVNTSVSGTYEFYVSAVNSAGVTSPSLSGTYSYDIEAGSGSLLNQVTGLQVVGGGTTFAGEDVNLQWTNPASNGTLPGTVLKDFEVRVVDPSSGTTVRTEWVPAVAAGANQKYAYTFAMNNTDGGPRRTVRFDVFARDTGNKLSAVASMTATNPAPAAVSNLVVTAGLGSVKVTFGHPTEADYKGILIWQGTTSTFVPSQANCIAEGDTTFFSLDVDTTPYYYKVAAYDTFGKSYTGAGLNLSGAMQATAMSATAGVPGGTTLPTTGNKEGDSYYVTTTGRLYFYHNGAWAAQGIQSGTNAQMLALTGMTVGDTFSNTTDSKLYRYNGTAWTAAVASADVVGQLVNAQIADNAVTAAKIQDGTITGVKTNLAAIDAATGLLKDSSVSSTKLVDGAVIAQKINVAAIDASGNLKSNTVNTLQLAANAVTAAKTAIAAIDPSSGNLTANSVTATQIQGGTITGDRLQGGTIGAREIAAKAITVSKLLVIPESIIPDPYFYDTEFWTANRFDTGWYFEDSNGAGQNVPAVMNVPRSATLAGANGVGTNRAHMWTANHPLSGNGQQYRFRATIWNGSNQTLILTLRFFGPTGPSIYDYNFAAVAQSGVTQQTGIVNIPANTASYCIIAYNEAPGTTLQGYCGVGAIKLDVATSGELLVDGAVTATKVAANAIYADAIQANAVTTDKIQAGSITANKLMITSQGTAINDDPFIQDSTAWNISSGIEIKNDALATTGGSGANFFNCPSFIANTTVGSSRRYVINPNKTYSLTANLFASSANDRNMYIWIQMWDAYGNQVGTTWGGALSGYTFGAPPPANVWSRQGGQFGNGTSRPIPPNVATCQIGVWFQYSGGGSSSAQQCAQDIRLELVNDGSLIVDGAITANKIAAQTITGNQIAGNSVNADRLVAGSITATQIQGSSITGDRIAGQTITGSNISGGSVNADRLVANSITAAQINAGSIQAAVLTAGSITTGMMNANSISGDRITGGTLTGDKIVGNTITSDKLLVGSLQAVSATIGTLRTATSGARIEISDNLITGFRSNNTMSFRISS